VAHNKWADYSGIKEFTTLSKPLNSSTFWCIFNEGGNVRSPKMGYSIPEDGIEPLTPGHFLIGKDDVVRVVTVKTTTETYKRPITIMALLPDLLAGGMLMCTIPFIVHLAMIIIHTN
jgi:hypothetical protein